MYQYSTKQEKWLINTKIDDIERRYICGQGNTGVGKITLQVRDDCILSGLDFTVPLDTPEVPRVGEYLSLRQVYPDRDFVKREVAIDAFTCLGKLNVFVMGVLIDCESNLIVQLDEPVLIVSCDL